MEAGGGVMGIDVSWKLWIYVIPCLISLKNEPIFPLSESLSGISLDMTASPQAEKHNCASEDNAIKVIPDFMSLQHCSLTHPRTSFHCDYSSSASSDRPRIHLRPAQNRPAFQVVCSVGAGTIREDPRGSLEIKPKIPRKLAFIRITERHIDKAFWFALAETDHEARLKQFEHAGVETGHTMR
jgi:hypothetical protein